MKSPISEIAARAGSLARQQFVQVKTIPTSSLRFASSGSKISGTVVDQTKSNNDPDANKKDHHKQAAAATNSSEGRGHPAKQSDHQKTPERATGIQTEGSQGKAGEGKDTGVHQQGKPPMTP